MSPIAGVVCLGVAVAAAGSALFAAIANCFCSNRLPVEPRSAAPSNPVPFQGSYRKLPDDLSPKASSEKVVEVSSAPAVEPETRVERATETVKSVAVDHEWSSAPQMRT